LTLKGLKYCTYEETGIFFFGVPPTGGFLFDFSRELEPVTERSWRVKEKSQQKIF